MSKRGRGASRHGSTVGLQWFRELESPGVDSFPKKLACFKRSRSRWSQLPLCFLPESESESKSLFPESLKPYHSGGFWQQPCLVRVRTYSISISRYAWSPFRIWMGKYAEFRKVKRLMFTDKREKNPSETPEVAKPTRVFYRDFSRVWREYYVFQLRGIQYIVIISLYWSPLPLNIHP